jgi:peptidoglycan/xylan/chitin deacetylase (PgdA/CDA1 family)
MLRTLIKSAVSRTLVGSGATRFLTGSPSACAPPLVLGYHRVVRDFTGETRHAIPAMLVSVAMLEQQLDWVGRRYRFATVDEVIEQLRSGGDPDKPIAAVTFDDGYRDVYLNALPLLRRKGIPAAVFVVTDLVGRTALQRHDALYILMQKALSRWPDPGRQLSCMLRRTGTNVDPGLVSCRTPFETTTLLLDTVPRPGIDRLIERLSDLLPAHQDDVEPLLALDWPMVREMHRDGFTIGSHTRSHALLTRESQVNVSEELAGSKQRLESELHAPIEHFAYPDGRFDGAVIGAAARTGYRFAYTICGHRSLTHPLLTIPRRMLWERSCVDSAGRFSPAGMECQVAGFFDWLSRCRHDHRAATAIARTDSLYACEGLEHS